MSLFFVLLSLTELEWMRMNYEEKIAFADTACEESLLSVLPFVERDEFQVKMYISEICGKRKIKESLGFLIKMAEDPSPAVRFEAVWSLGEIKDEKAKEAVIKRLRDPDNAVRYNAVISLRKFKAKIDHVIFLLSDEDPKIRKEALITIDILSPGNPPHQVVNLLEDKERSIVLTAIQVIGKAKSYEMVSTLERFLKSEDKEKKTFSALFLSRFNRRDAAEILLKNMDILPDTLKKKAAKIIALFPEKDIRVNGIKKLLSDDSWVVRKEAALFLEKIKERRDILLEFLRKEKHPGVVEELIKVAGFTGEKEIIPLIREYLNHDNPVVKEACCEALGLLGDTASFELLKARLQDESPLVRRKAAIALGRLKDKRAVPYIERRLFDVGWEVQEAACLAAGMIKDKSFIPSLKRLLSHKFWGVRKHALWALIKMGEEKIDTALIRRLTRDENYEVRRHAYFLLSKIRVIKEVPKELDSLSQITCQIMLGKDRWDEFKKMLEENMDEGIYLLGIIGTEKAKEILEDMEKSAIEDVKRKARIALIEF